MTIYHLKRETFKQIPKMHNTLQNWSCYRWKQLISTLEPGTYQEWYNTPIVLFFYPVCLYCICSVFGIFFFLNMIQVSAKWLEKTKQFFWKWSWLLGRKYKEMSGGSRLVDNTVLLKTWIIKNSWEIEWHSLKTTCRANIYFKPN